MWSDKLQECFDALGVPGDRPRALLLLPMLRVAWAPPRIGSELLTRLLDRATELGRVDREGRRIADYWATRRPPPEYFHLGLYTLRRLADAPDDLLVTGSDLCRAVSWAQALTQWKPGATRAQTTLYALDEISLWLGADLGRSWAALTEELGEPLLPVDSVRLPEVFPLSAPSPNAPSSQAHRWRKPTAPRSQRRSTLPPSEASAAFGGALIRRQHRRRRRDSFEPLGSDPGGRV